MQALVFHPTIPRYLLTRALGQVWSAAYWSPAAPIALRQMPEPPLPGPEWVRVRVRLGGICGSDLHLLTLQTSPATSVFASFPFVPGHENVGVVVETGPSARDLQPGQRVVVEPLLPCRARGVAQSCAPCTRGDYHLCVQTTDGHLSPGLMVGACRDTGGSWGETFVAHRSQVFPVPGGVSDENALLSEPAACALHSLLRNPPREGATALVVGGGAIGQALVACLRALGLGVRVVALVKYPHQAEMARRLGADHAVRLRGTDGHYEELAELLRARVLRPMLGKRVLVGGAEWVVDCVGSGRSLDDAFRLAAPGGTVVVLGLASFPEGVDWTPVWLKELRVVGSYTYALERWEGRAVRTLELVLDWMARGRLDLGALVTHRFPISRYREAFRTALGKAQANAFKVAFAFA
ncbi:Starvation-sensing protein RspB [bacterium HR32]|jgi:L-iditol 2-dehydrogenase|nr:Starvation-sensing protein RspB [bacterium HR32]